MHDEGAESNVLIENKVLRKKYMKFLQTLHLLKRKFENFHLIIHLLSTFLVFFQYLVHQIFVIFAILHPTKVYTKCPFHLGA